MAQQGKTMITGASSGSGMIYADRLAKAGHDLVLVARRTEKLQAIALELERRYGVTAVPLVVDLSTADGVDAAVKALEDEDITFLVNNAGTSTLGSAGDASVSSQESMIAVNVTALTRLTLALLPRLKARGSGTVINIGSVLGFSSLPISSIYSGTKAYIMNFTRGLQQEFAGTAIRIQLVAPAATAIDIWEISGVSLSNLDPSTIMTAEDCVDASLAGLALGEAVTLPSVEDQNVLEAFDAARMTLLSSSQTGRAASRYNSG